MVDWNLIAQTIPLGLVGVATVGIAGVVAVKSSGGLVEVAKRLADALGGGVPQVTAPELPAPVASEVPEVPETEPEGLHDISDENEDEFPPHERR